MTFTLTDELQKHFFYSDGKVFRLYKTKTVEVGNLTSSGYLTCMFNGRILLIHKIVWALHNKGYPECMVDHKNKNRLDNRIENLRLATRSENAVNSTSKPGRGVYYNKRTKLYEAKIGKDNKRVFIGCYKTHEEAAKSYQAKAKELFGEFAPE